MAGNPTFEQEPVQKFAMFHPFSAPIILWNKETSILFMENELL
jgi:hypothetical protein